MSEGDIAGGDYVLHKRPMRAINDYTVTEKLNSATEFDDDIQATLYVPGDARDRRRPGRRLHLRGAAQAQQQGE
jgi:hypothetical protein